MSPKNSMAEIFIAAFKALPADKQQAVLARLFKVRKWRKDLMDIALAEVRSREKSRPFRDFLAEVRK